MQTIGTCLWFDNQAEAAAASYTSIFKNSRILGVSRYPEGSPGPAGTVMTVQFELDGQTFTALNGGPQYSFTPAISFMVNCDTQAEVDRLWEQLGAGGTEVACGWMTDKFGVSWQIIPTALMQMITDPDKAASQRAFTAMLQMKKLDLARLEQAFKGR
ncbi:VOC family protein [Geothrix limicola]|uniref:VOC family protein n=1 Tax=Geothrix limicola TaxID=2927978 RepID=A0ABQ5QED6_9BACT|nr:VOC family protein [Geothrix limicola]GLH72701.1 VOC family protein [Geothrix limicola]